VNVQGAVNVPAVDSVEFRDQLYQAVENVVTTPLKAMVSGVATLVGGKKVSARASLNPPPNSWMVPVPFALEARQAVECNNCDELRAELVSNGVLVPPNMVLVNGGTLPQGSELAGQQVETFQIGKYEVTWDEWQTVRDWAVKNGYGDLAGVGSGAGDNHPVESVSWYDVVKWCNAKSEKEGLTPVYQANGATFKSGQIEPTINSAANGYRLPTDAEWEWAARGGVLSQGYTYSGSNDVDAVAWYIYNSGSTTHEIGTKASNELGIFDMSGNVWELVFDAYDGSLRRLRGTGFGNHEDSATVANRDGRVNSDYRYYEGGRNGVGFRLARSSGQ
jgi:formylglycine-generating enzyme required for sulfatase activity